MTNSSEFPLNIIWDKSFGWFFSAKIAPLVFEESVIVRCGDYLTRLTSESGETTSQSLIHQRAGDGTFLLNEDKRILTDYRRRSERLSTLVAFNPEDTLSWRYDLEAIVGKHNTRLVNGDLVVLGANPNVGQVLYILNPTNGELIASHALEVGANALLPYEQGFIVRNQTPTTDSYGLYLMDREALRYEPIIQDPVWNIFAEDAVFLVTLHNKTNGQFYMQALDENLAFLWSAPCLNAAICLYDGQAFCIEQGEVDNILACYDAETGNLIWNSDSFAESIDRIDVTNKFVFCNHMTGVYVFLRENGCQSGNIVGNFASPIEKDNKIYLLGAQTLYCAESQP